MITPQLNINVVGSGNVGTHLQRWLSGAGYRVCAVNPRTLHGLAADADISLIAVSDKAIKEVAEKMTAKLQSPHSLIAHTSGTTPLSILNSIKRPAGVLYPMQTFSKNRKLQYAHIPLFVEGSTPDAENILYKLASDISDSVRKANSQLRKRIHLGAVFACNFLNYMLTLAEKSISESGMGIDMYAPLINETVAKAMEVGPTAAQTGPARRADLPTIQAHLDLLANDEAAANVYSLLSQNIQKLYQ